MKEKKWRVVVTGGGTGGHIYPALAIAQGLEEAVGAKITYLGGANSLESRLAAEKGYPFIAIPCRGLAGASLATLRAAWINLKGKRRAKGYLRQLRPDVVIGTGGYAAAPVMLAAAALHIPTLIHEQNAVPGKANKLISRHADRVCLTFDAAKKHFPPQAHTVLTGLPVRPEILTASREEGRQALGLAPDAPVLLVTGGSQGAQAINEAMEGAVAQLLAAGWQVLHITGPKNFAMVEENLRQAGVLDQQGLFLLPYLDRMEYALAAADLVLARAGASFLAEVLCRGLPSVLVPYPYAAGNHQEENARSLEQAGAAIVIENSVLKPQTLLDALLPLMGDPERLLQMSAAACGLAVPEALSRIIETALAILPGNK